MKKPRSTDAYEGDDIVILCEVIGDPKPDVYWLRDFLKVGFDFANIKIILVFDRIETHFLHLIEFK